MKSRYVVRVQVVLDVTGYDRDDVYETLNAWSDAMREGDFEGLRNLGQVTRTRPQFSLSDIAQLSRPEPEPEPVTILNPTMPRGW